MEGGDVRGMRISRAVDVEARHRGTAQSRVSRDRTGVSVLDRSGSAGWSVDEADPAIARIRTHPILDLVDQVTSSAPCHACVARPSGSSARLGPGEAPVPGATKVSWAGRRRTSRWCSTPPCRRSVREERLPGAGRVEGT